VPTQGAHLPVLTYFQRRKPYSSGGDSSVSGSGYGRGVSPTPDASASRVLLDASAAPLLPAARDTLLAALDAGWADPRRLHSEGRQARALLDRAREVLAAGLGVRPPELSFLPSGPVALRAGCEGLLHAGRRRGARLVASAVEHSAVLTLGRHHAAATGDADRFEEVPVDRLGRVDIEALERALATPGTVAVAVQSANAEVGTRQPLAGAWQCARARGVPLLVDALASLGRDTPPTAYDVLAGDARSWGGPGGVGVLVVPERTRWRRPGPVSELEGGRTDAEPVVALALAAAEAWQQTEATRASEQARAAALVERIRAVVAGIPDTDVVGDPDDRLPHVVTFSCLYVDGEALVGELDRRGFAVASGSACTSSTLEPSHVLAAMGVLTHGNVRVTLPLEAVAPRRAADVERFLAVLPDAVAAVRAELGVAGL
jgi:cysteine desulfurase